MSPELFMSPELLEHYAYEVFIVLNLARPGSCDFFNLVIFGKDIDLKHRNKREEAQISAFNFDRGLEDSLNGLFPKLVELDLCDVTTWYSNLDLGVRQKAVKPIEKSLFALFHICNNDGEITDVVWIFHALEALYSTKIGENLNNLINRISFLLVLNSKQKSILNKRLRKLYSLRSSLVHGGYEIYHPMRHEGVDKSIESQFENIFETLQFGVAIIIASLQALIERNWYGIDVKEDINGKIQP